MISRDLIGTAGRDRMAGRDNNLDLPEFNQMFYKHQYIISELIGTAGRDGKAGRDNHLDLPIFNQILILTS